MKKVLLFVLLALAAALLVSCGTAGDPVSGINDNNGGDVAEGGLSEEELALLEVAGISEEQFNQMSEEQRAALLYELGIVADANKEKEEQASQAKKYTVDDVAGDGNYKVRIGDGRLNNYYLYYENGKLVKVECSFQKNDLEEPEEYSFEGDTLKDFWYIDKSLQGLIDYFDGQGYGYTHSISKY